MRDRPRSRAPARLALLAALAWMLGPGWTESGRATESLADPGNPAQVALGERVYQAHCAACHGAYLEGQPDWRRRRPDGRNPAPPHDYRGHSWRHSDQDLFGMVKQGFAAYAPPGYRTDMKGFAGTLTDAEIWAALAYIKSTWPSEFRAYQARITAGAKGRNPKGGNPKGGNPKGGNP